MAHSPTLTRIVLLLRILTCLLPLFFIGCGFKGDKAGDGAAKSKIRIGYQALTLSAPLYVAVDAGLFQQESVELEIIKFAGSGPMLEALVAGQIDVVVGFALPNAYALELQLPGALKMISLTVSTPEQGSSAILVGSASPISDLRGLIKKKIACSPPGSTMRTWAKMILDQNGVSGESVTLLSMAPGSLQEALLTGQCDAAFTMQPYITTLLNTKNARIISNAPLNRYVTNPFPGVGVFLRRASFEKSPELARRLIRVFDNSARMISDNENVARSAIIKWTDLPRDLALAVPLPTFLRSDNIDIAPVRQLAERMNAFDPVELPAVPTVGHFLD